MYPGASRRIALRTAARRGSGVDDPGRAAKTWLLQLFNTGAVGEGMVLALLDIRRARAPYRPGTATRGCSGRVERDAPHNVCNGSRGGSTQFQAATGEQPAIEQQPRRSARLLGGVRAAAYQDTTPSAASLPSQPGEWRGLSARTAAAAAVHAAIVVVSGSSCLRRPTEGTVTALQRPWANHYGWRESNLLNLRVRAMGPSRPGRR